MQRAPCSRTASHWPLQAVTHTETAADLIDAESYDTHELSCRCMAAAKAFGVLSGVAAGLLLERVGGTVLVYATSQARKARPKNWRRLWSLEKSGAQERLGVEWGKQKREERGRGRATSYTLEQRTILGKLRAQKGDSATAFPSISLAFSQRFCRCLDPGAPASRTRSFPALAPRGFWLSSDTRLESRPWEGDTPPEQEMTDSSTRRHSLRSAGWLCLPRAFKHIGQGWSRLA